MSDLSSNKVRFSLGQGISSSFRSCSLSCFKQHKDACVEKLLPEPSGIAETVPNPDQPSETGAETPFPDNKDLNELFKRYPNLRAQLKQIYLSTQNPSEHDRTSFQDRDGGGSSRRPWKPEKGFEVGLATLDRALRDGSSKPDGLAAFIELISEKTVA